MQKKRDDANPARADPSIASAIAGTPDGTRNGDGMPALAQPRNRTVPVPRVPATHPAAVQVSNLVGADGGARIRPIQTGHSTNKRGAVLISVAEGGIPPTTKSRKPDSMVVNFHTLQQEGMIAKAVKAQAALITAKGVQIQNQLQTLMFFERQPDSHLKRLITSNAQKSLAELSKPDDSYSPRPVPSDRTLILDDENDAPEENTEADRVEIPVKECSICQESILENTPSMITPCLHTFHFGCMRTWMVSNNTCPYCRGPLANPSNAQERDLEL